MKPACSVSWLLVAAGLLMAGGCAPIQWDRHAARSAANDHPCQVADIQVIEQVPGESGQYAYWLDVCGTPRYYEQARQHTTRKLGAVERDQLRRHFVDRTTTEALAARFEK